MAFKIKVMGITGDRVTFGIGATFKGQEISFDRSTYSMVPGEELTVNMHVRLETGGLLTEQGELEPTPDGLYMAGDLPLLYKVIPN